MLGTGAVGLVERRVMTRAQKLAARRSTSPQRSRWSRRRGVRGGDVGVAVVATREELARAGQVVVGDELDGATERRVTARNYAMFLVSTRC